MVLMWSASCSKKEFDDAVRDLADVDFSKKPQEDTTAPTDPEAPAPAETVEPDEPAETPESEPAADTADNIVDAGPDPEPVVAVVAEPTSAQPTEEPGQPTVALEDEPGPAEEPVADPPAPEPVVEEPVAVPDEPAITEAPALPEPPLEEPAALVPPAEDPATDGPPVVDPPADEPPPEPVVEPEPVVAAPPEELSLDDESIDELMERLTRAPQDLAGARAAQRALLAKGKPAVALLVEALGKDPDTAWYAGETLEMMGPEARNAVPALMKMLKANPYRAARTLSAIGSDAAVAAPSLLSILQESRDGFVRSLAATALGKIGRGVPGVVSALTATLADGDRLVRVSAARCLAYLGTESAEATAPLIAALKDTMVDSDTGCMMREAQGALLAIGPAAVPLLTRAVTTSADEAIRSATAATLKRMGDRAWSALPLLRRALTSRDEAIRNTAADVIEAIHRSRTIIISGQAPQALPPNSVADDVPVTLDTATTIEVMPVAPASMITLDIGGVKMELIYVKSGTNMMGSENGEPDETPVHIVSLSSGFYMAKTEVTQAQFEAITGWNPSAHRGADLPVQMVLWHEVVEFCRRLSRMTGLEVRLPTEAEWEYACRAGAMAAYGFGDNVNSLDQHAWTAANAGAVPHGVGRRQANAWGLHDMHGNVRELCYDRKSDDYYANSPRRDPTGPEVGQGRVVRGGSYLDTPKRCRSAARGSFDSAGRDRRVGFRVVVPLEGLVSETITVSNAITPIALRLKKAPDAAAKIAAIRELERTGSLGVVHLAGALRDRNEDVRIAAARTLGRIGGGARDATRHLAKRLSDRSAKVRAAAARALGDIGPDATGALPALENVTRDFDETVRREAAGAIAIIGGQDAIISLYSDPYRALVGIEDRHGRLCIGGTSMQPLEETGAQETVCPSLHGLKGRRGTFAIEAPVFIARITRANCHEGAVVIESMKMRWDGGGRRSETDLEWPLYGRGSRGPIIWTPREATAEQLTAAKRFAGLEREKNAAIIGRRDSWILQRESRAP
jgi:formylglycine-generating enzyme required for sulfatase activity